MGLLLAARDSLSFRRAAARAGLAGSLSVERLRESNILVVSYRAGNPEFAEIVLDELLRRYLDRHVAVHSQTDVQPFFTTQTEVFNKEIVSLQEQLASLKAVVGVADFAAERELQLRRSAALRDEELAVRRQLAELNGKISALMRDSAKDEDWVRTSTTTRPASQAREGLRAEKTGGLNWRRLAWRPSSPRLRLWSSKTAPS